VASDFPAGSCGYDLVLTHERKHWELARASFPKIKTKLEAKLADELAEGGFRFASAAEAAEKMRGYLGKLAYEAVKGVYLDELAQQAAIDSGSEIRGMVKALRQCQQVANAR
jgi:hypothetical protein